MSVNPDFKELFDALAEADARYLVVGAYAVVFHAEPRYSKDLDLWIEPTTENAGRVRRALAAFGAPVEDLTDRDLQNPDLVFQVGVEPNRVDVLMGVEGATFDEAWKRRVETTYGGTRIWVVGLDDLIRMKRATGRPQDLIDAENLERAREHGRPPGSAPRRPRRRRRGRRPRRRPRPGRGRA